MTRQTKADLVDQCATLRAQRDDAQTQIDRLDRQAAGARDKINTLKRKLHAAEQNVARMRGYIDRCLEDDAIREGETEPEQADFVPERRPPPFRRHGPKYTENREVDTDWMHSMSRNTERKPEWYEL